MDVGGRATEDPMEVGGRATEDPMEVGGGQRRTPWRWGEGNGRPHGGGEGNGGPHGGGGRATEDPMEVGGRASEDPMEVGGGQRRTPWRWGDGNGGPHEGKKRCIKGDKYVYDECGQRCYCQAGLFKGCVRIRKEFTQMSFDERRRYVNVYYKASTDPFYRDAFENLLNKHSEIPSNFLHHMPNIFFPWHRWHLLQIEDFLRQIDCRVTVPYYQWTARASSNTVWRTSDPTDVWNSGPQGISGNGVPPSLCVQDGKFRQGNWFMPTSKGGGCLKRNFNTSCDLYDQEKTNKLFKKTFKKFETTVRENLHAMFHDCIGGNMPDNFIASNAPEFVFHHSFMDKLWSSFQDRGLQYKYAYYPSVNFRMPFADVTPVQYLNNYNLPGGVGIVYEEMKKNKKKAGDDVEEIEEIEIDEDDWNSIE
ncbi:hypothetical protein QZH41_009431 [Actinostola sp. cb2023]|nr:hypothetical protein QZH41_009431 [Actinostola sp. cb2023]